MNDGFCKGPVMARDLIPGDIIDDGSLSPVESIRLVGDHVEVAMPHATLPFRASEAFGVWSPTSWSLGRVEDLRPGDHLLEPRGWQFGPEADVKWRRTPEAAASIDGFVWMRPDLRGLETRSFPARLLLCGGNLAARSDAAGPDAPGGAQRLLCLDFEGNVDGPPVLLGLLDGTCILQVIVDAAFAPLSEYRSSAHPEQPRPPVLALDETLRMVRAAAQRTRRRIVGFSRHDLEVIQRWCRDPELVTWYEDAYVNGLPVIRRWANAEARAGRLPRVAKRSLRNYLALVGITYPPAQGANSVGPSLTRLRRRVNRTSDLAALTPGEKKAWTRVREHNRRDVEGLALLMELAGNAGQLF